VLTTVRESQLSPLDIQGNASKLQGFQGGTATPNGFVLYDANGNVVSSGATKIDLTSKTSGVLPVANGGRRTAMPSLVAGSNVTITASWPNQTISARGGGASWSPDLLAESKPLGTPGSSTYKQLLIADNSTAILLNLSGQSGYVTYIWIGVGAKDTGSTMTITADGATVFNDRACLFFGAEYIADQSSFASRFIGASNNNSNNVGFYSYIPIPVQLFHQHYVHQYDRFHDQHLVRDLLPNRREQQLAAYTEAVLRFRNDSGRRAGQRQYVAERFIIESRPSSRAVLQR
jgi:hypothetical protein